MATGRTVAAGVLGLLLGLFVAVDLVLLGVISLNSPAVTLLAILGMLGGAALVAWGAGRTGTVGTASAEPAPPPPIVDEPPPPPPL